MLGQRLKEERERLKLNQTEFADACGVKKNAQIKYEKGERKPDTDYLEKANELGVDVAYILTGTRTPKVEMQVMEKVSKAKKTAQATGNQSGADNLVSAMGDMLTDMVKRGENAKNRAEELRQITLMLCDLDDEQFEKAYQAISDIHSNKQAEEQQTDSKNAIQIQQSNSNNNNFTGNTIGDVKNATIGNSNISHSFNQAGFTDLQFGLIGAICGILAIIFGWFGNMSIHTYPTGSFMMAILDLICLALTVGCFMLSHTTTNCVPSKRKKAPSI